MNNPVFFDHIEVHVKDIRKYCNFLVKLFQGGRYKIVSDTGTSMFKSNDGVNIEVKKVKISQSPDASGFCNPCLRMVNAKQFISKVMKLKIVKTINNPDGYCYFFVDHEGITWHAKDHLLIDKSINW